MSDIFISYKREEQAIARKLANALETQGWSVWWDPKLRAGERFNDVIEKALKEAKCVVVMWSKRSVESQYVKHEANYALRRSKLVPVMIEEVELPFRFEDLHTLTLLDWDGSKDFSEFRRLVEDIATIVGPPVTEAKQKEEERNRAQQEAEQRYQEEAQRKLEQQRLREQASQSRKNEEGVHLIGNEPIEIFRQLKARAVKAITFWNDGYVNVLRLPDELFEVQSLEALTIGYYDEVQIPNGIQKLKNLRALRIWNANLYAIPDPIYEIESLEELSLTNGSHYQAPGGLNSISELSPKILLLTKLKLFELDMFSLKIPPVDIAEQGIKAVRNYFIERGGT